MSDVVESPVAGSGTGAPGGELVVALAGNPNVGKTTLFNALTGLKQKVANYPGVTVEKKVGRCSLKTQNAKLKTQNRGSDAVSGSGSGGEGEGAGGEWCSIIDLPGTYSLASRSPDEHVARQVVLGQIAGTPRPDVIVVVADASNLERNLYLVTQVLELGRPTVLALSMQDVAEAQGKRVDAEKLSVLLKVPVVPVQAHRGKGIDALKAEIAKASRHTATPLTLALPEVMETHVERLKRILAEEGLAGTEQAAFDAHLMLSTGEDEADVPDPRRDHPRVRAEIAAALAACEAAEIDPIGAEVEAHYAYIGSVVHECVREEHAPGANRVSRTDKIDRIVTHKVWGMAIFVGIMGLIFYSIFSLVDPLMRWINDSGGLFDRLKDVVNGHMAEGPLRSLLTDGVIAGVGNVVVFLPQIALLFFFLALLEDSGYMSRAAFLMDRVMSKVGLHGKSFIPLLSGYACAVPAIMGTRVIENRRDRLATILVLPLMSCSARLPVYLLVIGTFFAGAGSLGRAGVLLTMYALGTLAAFGLAWVFKRTLLKGPAPAFILEMPPYRVPHWKVVIATVSQRCWAFLKRAGTLIFAFSVVMWAATSYPKPKTWTRDYGSELAKIEPQLKDLEFKAEQVAQPRTQVLGDARPEWLPGEKERFENLSAQKEALENAQAEEVLEHSAAGRVGKFIAPVFRPLGYDWKLSIGVTGAFFAREVIVSTMGVVYSVGQADEESTALKDHLAAAYTPLVGVSLMVFVVFCMQCLSTLAVAKRETGHWGWPVFMFVYMTGLAWVMAFLVYQGGLLLGFH
jgi:ferrous iron transport protein B